MLKEDMDHLFKQKLLSRKNGQVVRTFAEALLGDTSWLKKQPARKLVIAPSKEVFSEKVQVIESLERFTQEQIKDLAAPVFKIDGGEIRIKTEPSGDGLTQYKDVATLKSSLSLDPRLLEVILKDKGESQIKILFVSEKFRSWDEVSAELKTGFINELLCGFPLKTAELFERMIGAMKLASHEVMVFPVEGQEEQDYGKEVMELAAFYRPQIIVTLGAKATQKILKSSDRLTLVHGQFFNRKIGENNSFLVVPLFHPSIIESNPGMKKTTWTDMQKIMDHFKKLS